MKNSAGKIVWLGAAAALAGAVSLAIYGAVRPLPPPRLGASIQQVLPSTSDVPGWEIRHHEIKETPEIAQAIDELLNYDDAAFVSYIKDGLRISVYMAYWRPGKMPQRLIGGHTPDTCWVYSGWQTIDGIRRTDLPVRGSESAPAAEERRMRLGNLDEWVLFWHFVDAVATPVGKDARFGAAFAEAKRWEFDQRAEQLFLRVSSNQPVEAWWDTDVIQTLVASLRRAGAGF